MWATVAVDRPVEELYTYAVPESLQGKVLPGIRVRVPFGAGHAKGVVVQLGKPPPQGVKEIKQIQAVLEEEPLLTEELLRLFNWISNYYVCPPGETICNCLPPAPRRASGPRLVKAALPEEILAEELRRRAKRAPLQARLLAGVISSPEGLDYSSVLHSSPGASESLKKLSKAGLIKIERGEVLTSKGKSELSKPSYELSSAQRSALEEILRAVKDKRFCAFLLYGVTGSGKTEVYIRALEEVVAHGGQGLVLVPEIALTPQTFSRFRSRIPAVAVLHSLVPPIQRWRTMKAAKEGALKVVIGARSALFTPFSNLRLIVVDEEHETSFKSEASPRIQARDTAVMRAKINGIPVVLGSATPSLESYQNALEGKYKLIKLPERVTPRGLPHVRIIDLSRSCRAEELLSEELLDLTAKVLSEGKQAMFFLNRRGYARIVKCLRCGSVATCKSCSVALVYHARGEFLMCHTCGSVKPRADQCEVCGSATLRYIGAGTEKVVKDLVRRFPEAQIARLDRDTVGSRKTLLKVLDDFAGGRTDILVGTQMLAKGHDFPQVTLVGIVCADTSLFLPDFRAAERTFQLIHQVAGRAGRGEDPGVVVVQTFSPQNKVIQLAVEGDFESFAKGELKGRAPLGYPPFGRIARIVISAKKEEVAKKAADKLGSVLRRGAASVLGPAPCPITRARGKARYHLVIKGKNWREVNQTVRLGSTERFPGKVETTIDIDPVSFL